MPNRELAPPPGLEQQLACVWIGDGSAVRVLPDACVDIVWTRGELVVAGPATRPDLAPATPGQGRCGVRFRVGAAGGALGLPASELLDQVVPLAEIWGAAGGRLEDKVALAVRPADVFRTVERAVRAGGYDCIVLGSAIEGEARDVAPSHARLARALQGEGRRAVILSGGELTVTLRGHGRGGPNQEYALALAAALAGAPGIAALAGDTDGTDGGAGRAEDPAGAFVDASTLARAGRLGLDPAAFLNDNNSTEFFEKLGDLLTPGPTLTNVNDFRAIVVDRP